MSRENLWYRYGKEDELKTEELVRRELAPERKRMWKEFPNPNASKRIYPRHKYELQAIIKDKSDYNPLANMTNVLLSVYEREEGTNYAGFIGFNNSPNFINYGLVFERKLGKRAPPIGSCEFFKMVRFELENDKTKNEIKLDTGSIFDLTSIIAMGAYSIIDDGKYSYVGGNRATFLRTQVPTTKSIERFLSRNPGGGKIEH